MPWRDRRRAGRRWARLPSSSCGPHQRCTSTWRFPSAPHALGTPRRPARRAPRSGRARRRASARVRSSSARSHASRCGSCPSRWACARSTRYGSSASDCRTRSAATRWWRKQAVLRAHVLDGGPYLDARLLQALRRRKWAQEGPCTSEPARILSASRADVGIGAIKSELRWPARRPHLGGAMPRSSRRVSTSSNICTGDSSPSATCRRWSALVRLGQAGREGAHQVCLSSAWSVGSAARLRRSSNVICELPVA